MFTLCSVCPSLTHRAGLTVVLKAPSDMIDVLQVCHLFPTSHQN
jgi:hypothetical protein